MLFAFYKYIFYIPELNDSSFNVSVPYDEKIPLNKSSDKSSEKINNLRTIYKNNSPKTAFENHFSHVQVNGIGTVDRILRDDNEGKRHQKFILRLSWGRHFLLLTI